METGIVFQIPAQHFTPQEYAKLAHGTIDSVQGDSTRSLFYVAMYGGKHEEGGIMLTLQEYPGESGDRIVADIHAMGLGRSALLDVLDILNNRAKEIAMVYHRAVGRSHSASIDTWVKIIISLDAGTPPIPGMPLYEW